MKAAADSRGALTPSNVHRTFSVRLNRFTGTKQAVHIGSLRYSVSSVDGYRHFEKHPVSYDIECFKMAATYSPTMQRSTIGDAELNDPVRNGKGWDLSAITT